VPAGSEIEVLGNFTAGAKSGLATLASVEGTVLLVNGQTTAITPAGGTLTDTGRIDVSTNTGLNITGNVANSGTFSTGVVAASGNSVTVSGTFTNESGAYLILGDNPGTTNDTMTVGTLANSGQVSLEAGGTLNVGTLTNGGPLDIGGTVNANTLSNTGLVDIAAGGALSLVNGVTDVPAGSEINVSGSFTAGAKSGLATLASVEGTMLLENGQTNAITPAGGTLTDTGRIDVSTNTSLNITGNVANSGTFSTGVVGQTGNSVTVSGTFTNESGATLILGDNPGSNNDAMSLGTLANSGQISLEAGSTLNAGTLTNTALVDIPAGATLNLTASGTSTNSSTISLNGGTLEISGTNVTLAGAGTITLSPSTNSAAITGNGAGVVLTSANTIEGTGTISGLGLVNTGTILANQSTPLTILPSAAGLTNNGTLSVLKGDTLQIGTSAGGALTNYNSSTNTLMGGTYSVGGTLEFGASGTSIVTDAANISLTGAGAEIVDFASQNVLKNLQTITAAGSLTLGAKYGTFTTTGNFTNNGTLTVGTGDKFIVDLSDSLTNFSGGTLTGGTYKISGTLEFNGANIVTNDANITLTGAASKIDGSGNANGLANFAVNNGSFALGSKRSFTTAGGFTNNGSLTVGAGDTFDVTGSLSNLAGGTLTGGTYNVSGTLAVAGDISTNAANITLASSTASFGALAGFNSNAAAGKFTLSGNANFSTTGGSFTNAGLFTVSAGSTFTVGGSGFNFTQTGGTTTVDGTLAAGGAGSLNLNGGSLFGTGTLDYGVVDTATITPGNSATATGKLGVDGTYAQSLGGALDVTIGGKTAGTQYDQLNVTGTASLGGTLNITLAAGYTPKVGNTFDILNASSISGAFTTINGLAINGKESFTVTEVGNDEIVLTVVKGAAQTDSVTLTQSLRAGLVHGRYGRELYTQRQLAVVGAPAIAAGVAAAIAPGVAPVSPLALKAFRPRDDFGSPATAAPAAEGGSLGMSPVSAAAYNSMATMNHMRFECGVDVKALLQTSPKRLLRALWAAPDSKEALAIGYMTLTTTH
jgi:hypothetical protein